MINLTKDRVSIAVVVHLQRRGAYYWEWLENITRGYSWQEVKNGRLWEGRRERSLLPCWPL